MSGTGTGISGVFSLVRVPSMDLYGHLTSIVAPSHFYNSNFLNIFVL